VGTFTSLGAADYLKLLECQGNRLGAAQEEAISVDVRAARLRALGAH